MINLDMYGPYRFSVNEIDCVVQHVSPGNYALGYMKNPSTFVIQYVGRSDTDVAQRLKQHIWNGESYSHFKFSYANLPTDAYYKECKNYHDCDGSKFLNNRNHPDAPNGSWLVCPICRK